jgi:hypothetical protein
MIKRSSIVFLCSTIVFSQSIFAACPKPVTYLTAGTATGCNGYLFTPEAELEVRSKIVEYDYISKINKKQNELITILDERNLNLAKQVSLSQEDSKFNVYVNIGFFVLGSLVTGYIASNVNR